MSEIVDTLAGVALLAIGFGVGWITRDVLEAAAKLDTRVNPGAPDDVGAARGRAHPRRHRSISRTGGLE